MAIQFTRKDLSDGATETLTLVRLDSDGSLAVRIEAGTPDDPGDFVGLYDIDGDQIGLGNESWELFDDAEFTGREALDAARLTQATLRAHADPTGAQDREITEEEAEALLEQDTALVYLPIDELFRSWEQGTMVVQRWEPEAA